MDIRTDIKQVIVMRNDLNMRKGKMVAQGAHASIAFLREWLLVPAAPPLPEIVGEWFRWGMTKICVRVDSEEQLLEIHRQAVDAGLMVHLIRDAGLTEFGQPTLTCLAIGPGRAEEIDRVTGLLRLL